MSPIFSQTWQTLTAYRMRSTLAVVAITWGVISIVVLVALGEGFYQRQSASFALLVSNTQSAWPFQTSKPWKGLPSRRVVKIPDEKAQLLIQSGFVQELSLIYEKMNAKVTNIKGQLLTSYVGGIDSAYLPLALLKTQQGSRNISPTDITNHIRVAILNGEIAEMGKIVIGDSVKINGIPFYVIGLLSEADGGNPFRYSPKVLIPKTTYQDIWADKPRWMLVKPAEGVSIPQLRQEILSFFSRQIHFDPTDRDAIYLPDLGEGVNMINAFLRGIQIFLGASGAMTMAVGAIGVANIMFLSVTERTREIGVRLAIGATPQTILGQFMVEGMVLIFIGTSLGLLASYGVVAQLGQVSLPDWIGIPTITLSSVALSLLVTAMLAVLASYFPARRASCLTPVIALSARF
ncbi:ABC transporter permease [Candidatus Enterovibrio escicola]|nr:ABC transporter permease [Candidatus Enterovibrio escacola]